MVLFFVPPHTRLNVLNGVGGAGRGGARRGGAWRGVAGRGSAAHCIPLLAESSHRLHSGATNPTPFAPFFLEFVLSSLPRVYELLNSNAPYFELVEMIGVNHGPVEARIRQKHQHYCICLYFYCKNVLLFHSYLHTLAASLYGYVWLIPLSSSHAGQILGEGG